MRLIMITVDKRHHIRFEDIEVIVRNNKRTPTELCQGQQYIMDIMDKWHGFSMSKITKPVSLVYSNFIMDKLKFELERLRCN